jgi:hypothetical protein
MIRFPGTTLLLALATNAWAQGAADFGDAPDGVTSCQGGMLTTPSLYPTTIASPNAVLGREGPHHFPLPDPNADYFLGLAPTAEDLATGPFQPTCDWLTPPCDADDGPFVLCLNAACTTGVLSVPAGPCSEMAVAAFGLAPGPLAFWIFEASRGPFSTQPGFVNVAADWDLSASYGSAPGEWVLKDEVLDAAPWTTQIFMTAPFPATTVFPCTTSGLGWCIAPFWTRFHLSEEPLLATFDGVTSVWEGSGPLGGHSGGETEDMVVETDPQLVFDGPVVSCGTPVGSVRITLDSRDPICAASPPVPLAASSQLLVRRFGARAYQTGFPYLTEILQLDLVGFDPLLGPVELGERGDRMSLGKLDRVQAGPHGNLVAAQSFFDVFWRVELPSLGLVLDTGDQPMRLDAGPVTAFPPVGTPYRPPLGSQSLTLYIEGTQIPVGWMCASDFTVTQDCPKPFKKQR